MAPRKTFQAVFGEAIGEDAKRAIAAYTCGPYIHGRHPRRTGRRIPTAGELQVTPARPIGPSAWGALCLSEFGLSVLR
jgi:hypothetical protein